MHLKIEHAPVIGGRIETSFKLVENGAVLAAGYGFTDKAYLDRSIAISRRRVMGLRPLKANPKLMQPSTFTIIERWNDRFYGEEVK